MLDTLRVLAVAGIVGLCAGIGVVVVARIWPIPVQINIHIVRGED